jgi:hypothetical protein
MNAFRSRIKRIFDQFLHGGGGAFDDFAGGDAVYGFGGQSADGHQIR